MAPKSIGCVYSFSHDNRLLIYRTFCALAKHDIWYRTYVWARTLRQTESTKHICFAVLLLNFQQLELSDNCPFALKLFQLNRCTFRRLRAGRTQGEFKFNISARQQTHTQKSEMIHTPLSELTLLKKKKTNLPAVFEIFMTKVNKKGENYKLAC